jgi:hypothetical protein
MHEDVITRQRTLHAQLLDQADHSLWLIGAT